MGILQRIFASVRRRGWTATAGVAIDFVAEKLFDLRYGTDTSRLTGLAELSIPGENRALGTWYQPTKPLAFRRFLKALKLPKDSVFVDFGSGKGRVLLQAAEYGFRRIVGVEFAAELCQIARDNVAAFRRKTGAQADIRIMHCDAVAYPIDDEDDVFYLFHPFQEPVLEQVVENICRSLRKKDRRVLVIYCHPTHQQVLQRRPEFSLLTQYAFGSSQFVVYGNRPLSTDAP